MQQKVLNTFTCNEKVNCQSLFAFDGILKLITCSKKSDIEVKEKTDV